MNIIFGKEQHKHISGKYTLLELDSFRIGPDGPIDTAYCVVEIKLLDDMITLETNQQKHQQLIRCYQSRDWDQALDLIEQLLGLWDGELDSFYIELQQRINQLKIQNPDDTWTALVQK